MENKDLSIIVPIFNVETYLEECLETIFSITGIKKEVILVNDGSTDSSYKIIEEYKEKYPLETIIINHDINKGLSGARNSGLKIAEGEYVFFIDSDDYINPENFIKLLEKAKKEKLDMIIGEGIKVYENFKNKKEKPFPNMEHVKEMKLKGFEYLQETLKNRTYDITVWNKIYNNNFLKKNDIYYIEGLLHEDIPFTFKCFFYSKKVMFYNIPFYYYRQRNGSIMKTMNLKNYYSILEILKYLLEIYDLFKINNKYFNSYLLSIYYKNYSELIKIDHKKIIINQILKKNKLRFIENIRKYFLLIKFKYEK